jgi:hypothetical protein
MKLINALNGMSESFEPLPIIPSVPIFNGVTDQPISLDIFQDLSFWIGKDTGTIQLANPVDLDKVYYEQTTNAPIGAIWFNHHEQLKNIILDCDPSRVIEIGGAHGFLAEECLKSKQSIRWSIVDPNPIVKSSSINVRKGYFDPFQDISFDHDLLVASHVFEHIPNLHNFLLDIYICSKPNIKLLVSIPDLCSWMQTGSPNALNFEHSTLLSETHFDELLANTNFSILKKSYYGPNHSIIYLLEKLDRNLLPTSTFLSDQYEFHNNLFRAYVSSFAITARDICSQINDLNPSGSRQTFLFGAHLFSQFLIASGLDVNLFDGVLDNNCAKHGRRLYGSTLITSSPNTLSQINDPIVVIKAGVYTHEISSEIRQICPSVSII